MTSLDLRLVAVDMDGTLLDGEGRIPDGLWPLLERMRAEGIMFAPASGRQYATLRALFGEAGDDMVFIAENGTYVVRHDEELSADPLARDDALQIVQLLRTLPFDLRVVVAGKRSAYLETRDADIADGARQYYRRLDVVDDVAAIDDEVLKVAVYDVGDAEEGTYPALAELAATHQVVLAGRHWVDIMPLGVDKGTGLRHAQALLGVTPAQTAAFGDYLNDLPLFDAAQWSFAMAGAHPDVIARARFQAPSHIEYGVVTTIERLLDGELPPHD